MGLDRGEEAGLKLDKLAVHLQDLHLASEEASALLASLLSIPLGGRYPNPGWGPLRQKEKTLDFLLDWLRAQIDVRNVPIPARLTGTGACIFASFEHVADAERIAARVPDRWNGFVARGLNRSPLHEMLEMEG